jgi:hypothetical protein
MRKPGHTRVRLTWEGDAHLHSVTLRVCHPKGKCYLFYNAKPKAWPTLFISKYPHSWDLVNKIKCAFNIRPHSLPLGFRRV